MYLFYFVVFVGFLLVTYADIHNINVGILQDISPNFKEFSHLVSNSILLAFNSTIYNQNFIIHIENVTSSNDCEAAVDKLYTYNVSVVVSIVSTKCLRTIYKRNQKEESMLLVPQGYTFEDCIDDAYFGSLFLHRAYKRIYLYLYYFLVLSELDGNAILIGYEGNPTLRILSNLLNSTNNYYSILRRIKNYSVITYNTPAETIKSIESILSTSTEQSNNIILTLLEEDTEDLFESLNPKSDLLSKVEIYSLIDGVESVFTTNNPNIKISDNYHILINYIYNYTNTEFAELYSQKYGKSDKIIGTMYISYYIMKHWLDCVLIYNFPHYSIIYKKYESDIITPEITLYYHQNHFFYSNYYLMVGSSENSNGNNQIVLKTIFDYKYDNDIREYSPVITNLANDPELCQLNGIYTFNYLLVIYNHYMCYKNTNKYQKYSVIDYVLEELRLNYDSEQIKMIVIPICITYTAEQLITKVYILFFKINF